MRWRDFLKIACQYFALLQSHRAAFVAVEKLRGAKLGGTRIAIKPTEFWTESRTPPRPQQPRRTPVATAYPHTRATLTEIAVGPLKQLDGNDDDARREDSDQDYMTLSEISTDSADSY